MRNSLLRIFTMVLVPTLAFALRVEAKTDYIEFKTLNLKSTFKLKKDWHLTLWQDKRLNDDQASSEAARYCFWYEKSKKEKDAVSIVSGSDFDVSINYPHQSVDVLELTKIQGAENGIILKATFSGGGSGRLSRNEVWVYDSGLGEFKKALCLNLTEQGQIRLISAGALAGTFIAADAHWGTDESHFEPHYFTIQLYKFDKGANSYIKLLEYLSAKKYDSLDSGAINVIEPELPAIQKNLKAIYGPRLFPVLKGGSLAADNTSKPAK